MTRKQLLFAAIVTFLFALFGLIMLTHGAVPYPPASEPPEAPDGYVLWPDPASTNGALQMWKVAGEVTVTNRWTEVEAVKRRVQNFYMESKTGTNAWAAEDTWLTVHTFDTDEKFYRLLIDGEVITPQWTKNLASGEWVSAEVRIRTEATGSNVSHRLKVEL